MKVGGFILHNHSKSVYLVSRETSVNSSVDYQYVHVVGLQSMDARRVSRGVNFRVVRSTRHPKQGEGAPRLAGSERRKAAKSYSPCSQARAPVSRRR